VYDEITQYAVLQLHCCGVVVHDRVRGHEKAKAGIYRLDPHDAGTTAFF
jgi:hypothetical protein